MRVAILVSNVVENDNNQSVMQDVEYQRNVTKYNRSNRHTYDTIPLTKTNAKKLIDKFIREEKYDVFINLCDERCAKIAAANSGIPIPDFEFVRTMEDFRFRMERLREISAPWIVKTVNSYNNSTQKVKVSNIQDLERQVKLLIETGGGDVVVVEQFIQGPEYTVLVVENPDDYAEPLALTPVRRLFSDDLIGFDDFTPTSFLSYEPVVDEKIVDRLKNYSKMIFKMLIGNGCATCDFRLNIKTDEVNFLEINTKCQVFCDDAADNSLIDGVLGIDPLGHEGFINLIIECALKRQKDMEKKIEVDYYPKKGFFIKATKDFEMGEIVFDKEPHSVSLLSKKYVEKNWSKDPILMSYFQKYYYQYGPQIYCTFEADSKDWKPINHSCDPNAWMDALAVVARRPIKKGDEITIDYATYAYSGLTDNLNEFECNCKSVKCRKIIRPSLDHALPELIEKYRGHFSTFVENLVSKRDMYNDHEIH
uniref:SET domain-containing protein-lysine N-methyltransferase n=1 Tax=Romanomermis culicivorax TaxID=13658 RepID=A0A915HX18_ROMCU